MKRSSLLFIASLFVIVISAQESITFKIPVFSKFLRVTTENVNMRKAANTQSAKLMLWHSDGGSEETQTYPFYSGEGGGKFRAGGPMGAYVEACHPQVGQILPVLGVEGDWSKVLYTTAWGNDYIYHRDKVAYIMTKFGTVFEIVDGIQYAEVLGSNYSNRTDSKYSSLKYAVSVDEYDNLSVSIGYIFDNRFFCKWSKIFTIEDADNPNDVEMIWRKEYDEWSDEEFLACVIKINTNLSTTTKKRKIAELLNTMPVNEFNKLISLTIDKEATKGAWVKNNLGEIVFIPGTYGDAAYDAADKIYQYPIPGYIKKTITFQ